MEDVGTKLGSALSFRVICRRSSPVVGRGPALWSDGVGRLNLLSRDQSMIRYTASGIIGIIKRAQTNSIISRTKPSICHNWRERPPVNLRNKLLTKDQGEPNPCAKYLAHDGSPITTTKHPFPADLKMPLNTSCPSSPKCHLQIKPGSALMV